MNAPSRKAVVAVAGGLLVGGLIMASANTLGSLTPDSIGTSSTAVSTCDSDGFEIVWDETSNPTYAGDATAANSTYTTNEVTLGDPTGNTAPLDINGACVGKKFKVAVADNSGASLSEATGTVALTSGSMLVTLPDTINTKNIYQTTVTFYDAA
ncbi:MAG: hypothetical protein U0R64_04310 [Candidatus Nanopelagicales bacterium]